MCYKWTFVAVLALVALAAEEVRSTENDWNDPHNEFIMTSCPHVIRRIATPQQISGVWYSWQLLEQSYDDTCFRYTFGIEGDRLILKLDSLLAGEVNATMNFTYEQNPTTTLWAGIGEVRVEGFQMGFASDDDSLLLMCSSSIVRVPFAPPEEDVGLSTLLGRELRLDEAKISAAVNETALAAARAFREVVTERPSLQECTAPAGSAV